MSRCETCAIFSPIVYHCPSCDTTYCVTCHSTVTHPWTWTPCASCKEKLEESERTNAVGETLAMLVIGPLMVTIMGVCFYWE
jgi:hypothetical protein